MLRNLGDDVVGKLSDGQKLSGILYNHFKNDGSLVYGDEAVRLLKYLNAQARSLLRAGRQITAWLDRSSRDNAQADADVQYIHAIAPPETQRAVLATQRGNQHATASTNTSIDLSTDLNTSSATIHSTSAAIEKSSAVDSATAWKAYQVALASLDEGVATTAVDKAYQDALAHVTRNSRVAYANLTYTESVAQIGSVAERVSVGFMPPTVHGLDRVVRVRINRDSSFPWLCLGTRIICV